MTFVRVLRTGFLPKLGLGVLLDDLLVLDTRPPILLPGINLSYM